MAVAPLGPIPDPERSRFLDVLRGIALLGILPANLPLFAIPMLALDDPAPVTGGLRESFAYYTTRLVVDYKFITIFSLLFGVGLMVIRRRREAAQQPFRTVCQCQVEMSPFLSK